MVWIQARHPIASHIYDEALRIGPEYFSNYSACKSFLFLNLNDWIPSSVGFAHPAPTRQPRSPDYLGFNVAKPNVWYIPELGI